MSVLRLICEALADFVHMSERDASWFTRGMTFMAFIQWVLLIGVSGLCVWSRGG